MYVCGSTRNRLQSAGGEPLFTNEAAIEFSLEFRLSMHSKDVHYIQGIPVWWLHPWLPKMRPQIGRPIPLGGVAVDNILWYPGRASKQGRPDRSVSAGSRP